MQNRPLAYHITFGIYGTRLHGDRRGTVDRGLNNYGDPIVGSDRSWWSQERDRMRFDPIVLDREKMQFVESSIPDICTRERWKLHTCAGGPDHVHTLLTAETEGDAVRKWFKRWLGEAMSARWRLPDGAIWWAEGGSVKWVWTEDYFRRAFNYVQGQRATK